MDVVELERLLIQYGELIGSGVFPGGNVGEMFVIAESFAIRSLILFAEMSAAAFVAMERIAAHEFAEFEEVGHTPGVFELLIEFFAGSRQL